MAEMQKVFSIISSTLDEARDISHKEYLTFIQKDEKQKIREELILGVSLTLLWRYKRSYHRKSRTLGLVSESVVVSIAKLLILAPAAGATSRSGA